MQKKRISSFSLRFLSESTEEAFANFYAPILRKQFCVLYCLCLGMAIVSVSFEETNGAGRTVWILTSQVILTLVLLSFYHLHQRRRFQHYLTPFCVAVSSILIYNATKLAPTLMNELSLICSLLLDTHEFVLNVLNVIVLKSIEAYIFTTTLESSVSTSTPFYITWMLSTIALFTLIYMKAFILRIQFLQAESGKEWKSIVNECLPSKVLITRYNAQTGHLELKKCNAPCIEEIMRGTKEAAHQSTTHINQNNNNNNSASNNQINQNYLNNNNTFSNTFNIFNINNTSNAHQKRNTVTATTTTTTTSVPSMALFQDELFDAYIQRFKLSVDNCIGIKVPPYAIDGDRMVNLKSYLVHRHLSKIEANSKQPPTRCSESSFSQNKQQQYQQQQQQLGQNSNRLKTPSAVSLHSNHTNATATCNKRRRSSSGFSSKSSIDSMPVEYTDPITMKVKSYRLRVDFFGEDSLVLILDDESHTIEITRLKQEKAVLETFLFSLMKNVQEKLRYSVWGIENNDKGIALGESYMIINQVYCLLDYFVMKAKRIGRHYSADRISKILHVSTFSWGSILSELTALFTDLHVITSSVLSPSEQEGIRSAGDNTNNNNNDESIAIEEIILLQDRRKVKQVLIALVSCAQHQTCGRYEINVSRLQHSHWNAIECRVSFEVQGAVAAATSLFERNGFYKYLNGNAIEILNQVEEEVVKETVMLLGPYQIKEAISEDATIVTFTFAFFEDLSCVYDIKQSKEHLLQQQQLIQQQFQKQQQKQQQQQQSQFQSQLFQSQIKQQEYHQQQQQQQQLQQHERQLNFGSSPNQILGSDSSEYFNHMKELAQRKQLQQLKGTLNNQSSKQTNPIELVVSPKKKQKPEFGTSSIDADLVSPNTAIEVVDRIGICDVTFDAREPYTADQLPYYQQPSSPFRKNTTPGLPVSSTEVQHPRVFDSPKKMHRLISFPSPPVLSVVTSPPEIAAHHSQNSNQHLIELNLQQQQPLSATATPKRMMCLSTFSRQFYASNSGQAGNILSGRSQCTHSSSSSSSSSNNHTDGSERDGVDPISFERVMLKKTESEHFHQPPAKFTKQLRVDLPLQQQKLQQQIVQQVQQVKGGQNVPVSSVPQNSNNQGSLRSIRMVRSYDDQGSMLSQQQLPSLQQTPYLSRFSSAQDSIIIPSISESCHVASSTHVPNRVRNFAPFGAVGLAAAPPSAADSINEGELKTGEAEVSIDRKGSPGSRGSEMRQQGTLFNELNKDSVVQNAHQINMSGSSSSVNRGNFSYLAFNNQNSSYNQPLQVQQQLILRNLHSRSPTTATVGNSGSHRTQQLISAANAYIHSPSKAAVQVYSPNEEDDNMFIQIKRPVSRSQTLQIIKRGFAADRIEIEPQI